MFFNNTQSKWDQLKTITGIDDIRKKTAGLVDFIREEEAELSQKPNQLLRSPFLDAAKRELYHLENAIDFTAVGRPIY